MPDESFLLVSLDEERSKQLAQVLSNDTARKILDFMSKREYVTETEVSKELSIPLSTAHYNLGLLSSAKLISDEHFNYSEKGKKIVHYSLSNKYVIIAPKKTSILKEKLKEFLPVVLITGVISFALKFYNANYFWTRNTAVKSYAGDMVQEEGRLLAAAAEPATEMIQSNQEFAIWFFAGSITALLIYSLVLLILKRDNRNL